MFCWTDSEVALCWVNGKEKILEPWIENGVVTIRKMVDREKWHFVEGELNPANFPTQLSSSLKAVLRAVGLEDLSCCGHRSWRLKG